MQFIPEEFYPFLDLVFVFRLASMETTYYWQTKCTDKPHSPTGPQPTVGECVLMQLETDSENISVFLCYILLPRYSPVINSHTQGGRFPVQRLCRLPCGLV